MPSVAEYQKLRLSSFPQLDVERLCGFGKLERGQFHVIHRAHRRAIQRQIGKQVRAGPPFGFHSIEAEAVRPLGQFAPALAHVGFMDLIEHEARDNAHFHETAERKVGQIDQSIHFVFEGFRFFEFVQFFGKSAARPSLPGVPETGRCLRNWQADDVGVEAMNESEIPLHPRRYFGQFHVRSSG